MLARRPRSGLGASEGTPLLEAASRPATVRKYVNNWEMFEILSPLASLCPPLAAPEAIFLYLGVSRRRGTVAAGSQAPLPPIPELHALAGYPTPTVSPLVKAANRGYRRVHTASVGRLWGKRGTLSAGVRYFFLGLYPTV